MNNLRKHKSCIIGVAIIMVITVSVGLFLTFWRPDALGRIEEIHFQYYDNVVELKKGEEGFPEAEAAVKDYIKGSLFSIFAQGECFCGSCSDYDKEMSKKYSPVWVEVFQKGKYKKLFFVVEPGSKMVMVLATKTDSYDDGKFRQHGMCNADKLIDTLSGY